MQALLVEYLEKLDSHLSLSDYEQLLQKAETILPKSMFGKLKQCFEYESGWLFVGLDFDSLEDKISAVTTNDPQKIKVYSDGYDGHALRALAYFGDEMPDVEMTPNGGTSYEAIIRNDHFYFHSEEVIDYLGTEMLGKELYTLIMKGKS